MKPLRSPRTGAALRPDTPHSLDDGECRWPVIDGIPFLRAGRERLARDAVACLDTGDREGALTLLLADADDWWDGAPPPPGNLQRLIRERDSLALREAMALLGYGRVGDYFAHRWTDPTFLAGLALIEAHWDAPKTGFELACGIGHYLREWERVGVAATGADVVFSKLWLARHWVVGPATSLICFDAAHPWPIAGDRFDLVLCQDAFYFLEPKAAVLAALRGAVAPDGTLLVGHVHNAQAQNASAGHGVTATDLATMFSDAVHYDDAELTGALADGRAPVPASPATLTGVDAFAIATGSVAVPRPIVGGIALPAPGTALQRNPLYGEATGPASIRWPSARYQREYEGLVTYPLQSDAPLRLLAEDADAAAVRCREFVHLPERW